MKERARSGNDTSTTYLYVKRIQRCLHITVLIINRAFYSEKIHHSINIPINKKERFLFFSVIKQMNRYCLLARDRIYKELT